LAGNRQHQRQAGQQALAAETRQVEQRVAQVAGAFVVKPAQRARNGVQQAEVVDARQHPQVADAAKGL
jgi:predicted alpha/beta hydrolase family esterase